ncbi:hypothetical protein ACNOYE_16565 [Nannocystaceae bacterium ST9]
MRSKQSLAFCQVVLSSWVVTGVACSDEGGSQDEVGDTGSDDEASTSGDGDASESGSDSSSTDPGDTSEAESSTDPGDTSEAEATTDPGDTTESTTETGGDPQGADYGQPGPYAVDVSEGSMQVNQQCNLAYAVYEPDTLLSDTAVLLAHGFMRSIDDMAATAEHIASWGVKVYAVPLCTNSFQIDHQLNGEAIALLGQALEPAGPVYAGFSAGGLAAWVAAANDPATVGYVGLDAVDNGGLAGMFAADLAAPIHGVVAEPGQCNTNNNFLPVYDGKPSAPVIRVVDAQHFDFETDACELADFGCSFCAPNGPATRATALGLVTSAILIETAADLGGETWWAPGGSYFDMLAQQGKIQLIQ